MKMKAFTKITSSILCAALTMQIGWALNAERVNATGSMSTAHSSTGTELTLSTNSNITTLFNITSNGENSYKVQRNEMSYPYESEDLVISGNISKITLEGVANLVIATDLESEIVLNSASSYAEIKSGYTFTNKGISGTGSFYVDGTLKCGSFSLSSLGNLNAVTVKGTIEADDIDLSYIGNGFTDTDTAVYKASSSFTKGNVYDLNGTVVAEPTTTIDSAGGSFTLQVGNATKVISDSVSIQTAASLFDNPDISLGNVPDSLYYGQAYDFNSLISVGADGYDEDLVYLEYSSSSDYPIFTTEKPTAQGYYYVRAVAPSYGSYLGTTSSTEYYSIDYLPFRDIFPVGSKTYDSVSGIVNGKYVSGNLVLKMPDGVLIKGSSFDSGDFSNTITLTPRDVLIDGHVNQDSLIQLRRDSDDATTNGNISIVDIYPDITNLVYDLDDPYVDVQFVDDVEASIEDNRLTGDKVEIGIGDDNLDKIYINGELYEYEDPDGEGWVEIELNSTPGQTTKYTIKATDLAGRSTTLSFTLYPNAIDPSLSVSVPEIVYAGDDYDVTVKTNSDGRVSYQYNYTDRDTYLESKPTGVGKYVVSVKVAGTDLFNAAEGSATYTIIKRTPTAEIYVPDSNIGESYSPVVTTDSDGKGEAVIEYKPIGTDDKFYSTTKPSIIGSYTVRVTIPETSRYNAAVATSEFTIKKKVPAFVLSIGSPYVGTDYKPSVTTNSDGAAKVVIEYKAKDASDDTYTTTVPTTYGTYVVRATVPETATFASVYAATEFTLRYLEAPANAFEMTGTAGKNGYYVSGVELKAPAGYLISGIYGGTYTESITYTDSLTSVYLKRTSDNALTSAITVNKPKIDTQAPSFKAGTGNVVSGSVMYVSNLNLTVDDPNLKSLKVNGEPINLTADKDNVLTLSPGFGTKTFKITAEDEAGNVSNIEFTLKAEWLESKTIIPDVVLPLEGNESYNLEEGYWIVTRNTPTGPVKDNTVYSGGMPFYVEEGGDYTFTKVTGT